MSNMYNKKIIVILFNFNHFEKFEHKNLKSCFKKSLISIQTQSLKKSNVRLLFIPTHFVLRFGYTEL